MKEYLENRIKELKQADVSACENRWDMSKSKLERAMWRENSNEITARRRELEDALKFLNEESVNVEQGCECEEHRFIYDKLGNEFEECINCGRTKQT